MLLSQSQRDIAFYETPTCMALKKWFLSLVCCFLIELQKKTWVSLSLIIMELNVREGFFFLYFLWRDIALLHYYKKKNTNVVPGVKQLTLWTLLCRQSVIRNLDHMFTWHSVLLPSWVSSEHAKFHTTRKHIYLILQPGCFLCKHFIRIWWRQSDLT